MPYPPRHHGHPLPPHERLPPHEMGDEPTHEDIMAKLELIETILRKIENRN